MRATPPINITSALLTSSTAAEPHDPPEWVGIGSPQTTYGFGDIVKVAADYAIYESLQAGNTSNVPSTSPLWWRKIGPTETAYDNTKTDYALGATVSYDHRCYESLVLQSAVHPLPVPPETETAYWAYVQPTNKYCMFDGEVNSQTIVASPLTTVVAPGQRINTVGMTRMKGNTLLIKATSVSAGGIIYPLAYSATKTYAKGDCMTVGLTTCYQAIIDVPVGTAAPNATYWAVVSGAIFDLNTREVFDAYTYYYEPFSTRPTKTVFDIPPVSDVIVTVTITSTSGNVKCGSEVLGTNVYIGKLLKPSRNNGKSFSSVTRDLYSKATLVKRPMIRRLEGNVLVDSFRIDKLLKLREELDATAALYSGLDEDGDWNDATTILGTLLDFPIGTTDNDDALVPFSAEEI